jgi:Protein of unknown function (DUF3168)
MATGLQRLLRRAILTRLKSDTGLTNLVPAGSIYPQAISGAPTWPFVKLGPPVTLRYRATCVTGGNISLDVHAFARARESGGVVVETAEDHCGRIGENIERVLADNNLTLEGGATAKLHLTDIRLFQDEEPDAFHYMAQINARVLAEA